MDLWLAMLTFLSPWWAAGALGAIGLPLLAHLLSKTRYREVWFPATRLVREATVQTTRIERPRHRLLMLLRWLLLLMVVVAFMRPRWLPDAQATDNQSGVAFIVLIDSSASMQRTADGATLYERALREADTLIAALDPARDVAAVIRVDRTPQSLLPETTAQLQTLRDQLLATNAGYETADWDSAVSAANRLAQSTSRRPQLVVISDQQGQGPRDALSDSPLAGVKVHHLRIDGPTDNTAIRLIDIRPFPPALGQSLTAIIEATHFGEQSASFKLNASLGSSKTSRALTLKPGGKQLIELTLPSPPPGQALLRLAIDRKDLIDSDNTAGILLAVDARSRALVLHADNPDVQALAGRVAKLINPGDTADQSLPSVETAPVSGAAERIATADARRLRTIVLLQPGNTPLAEPLTKAITSYTQRGGGVIHFLTPSSTSRAAQPATRSVYASAIDFSLGPLRVFEGPSRAGLANLAWPGVDRNSVSGQNEPILITTDGREIVFADTRQRGRVVTINADVSGKVGGLLAEPMFVVLFNELRRYASPGPAMPAPFSPGQALPPRLRDAPRRSLPSGVNADTSRVDKPGAYLAIDDDGEVTAGLFAQLDPAESDTRRAPDWSARESTSSNADSASATQGQALASAFAPPHVELWPYFVFSALLLAAGESLLLYRFAHGQGGVA